MASLTIASKPAHMIAPNCPFKMTAKVQVTATTFLSFLNALREDLYFGKIVEELSISDTDLLRDEEFEEIVTACPNLI